MIAKQEGQAELLGPPSSGGDVVAAAVRGDRASMCVLWEEHRRWVAAVLLTHKPPAVDLEDLLQEVAMRLVSKIETLREEANVRAWLRAVAVNVARTAGRSTRSSRVTATDEIEAAADDAAGAPEAGTLDEEARRMMDLVQRLPDLYREPLLLRAVNGMRTRQIAEILDLPPATVDTRIARARRMLRERLEGGAETWETDPDAGRAAGPAKSPSAGESRGASS